MEQEHAIIDQNFKNLKLILRILKCALKKLSSFFNLKEKSSGQFQGRLKLSKRGSSTARKYLFLAALRLIQNDPVIAKWYRAATERPAFKTMMKLREEG